MRMLKEMLVAILSICLSAVPFVKSDCTGGASRCQFTPWQSWSSCSLTCGGGSQRRWRPLCCKAELADDPDACYRDCGISRDLAYEYRGCNAFCHNGGTIHYDYNKYGDCRCPPTHSGTCCDIRMCAWNDNFCWPGYCHGGYASQCYCATGFFKVATTSQTKCELLTKPSILTCETVAVGPKGEKKRAQKKGDLTSCQHLMDVYGNFQPSFFDFDLSAEFTVNTLSYTKPDFISESNFGITDMLINVTRKSLRDQSAEISSHSRLIDSSSSQKAKQTEYDSGSISLNNSTYNVLNGEALCLNYEIKAGGYLKSENTVTHQISSAIPYRKVTTERELCYRYDNAPPEHCQTNGACDREPLHLPVRIVRSSFVSVDFFGWIDPIPVGGRSVHASSIESYQITLNEVSSSKGHPSTVSTKVTFTKKVDHTETSMDIVVNSEHPVLYCLTLEVKDVADNIKQARRFLLYDNSSFISARSDKPFQVISASSEANYTWQTHHNDICLSWKDHFLNKFYMDNELLNPIKLDAVFNGVYEQLSGDLPVSGTPNVYGIIKFMFSWKVNEGNFTAGILVPDFLNQTYCENLNVEDGQTYTLQIRPVDIVGNDFTEETTVHIDRSVPHIDNMWLEKDGYRTLFVHHVKDLSVMRLHFEVYDPHSGIQKLFWRFGEAGGTELASGALGVNKLTVPSCREDSNDCYCPDVGPCEMFWYTVPLNKLVSDNKHLGDHNRYYFFTIIATNNANLNNIEHLDILVDDSPPETGVIYEGPDGEKDIDYTSDEFFMVHWHGFIDHESGIREYRIGLADRCLGEKELYNFSLVQDIEFYETVPFTESSSRIPANFIGKYYVSVIALNNAMDPSAAVCSDGITRDVSPPELRNVTLQNAKWSESIVCHDGSPWLLHSSVSKLRLNESTACKKLCAASSKSHALASAIPTRSFTTTDYSVSEFLCTVLPLYDNATVIYLPNDHLYLSWEVEEKGSQVNEFFVGIGTDPSEYLSPSIDNYISTSMKTYFKRRHEGVGSDQMFYIFIKTVNKAGLEKVTSLGPVLIDETPPLNKGIPVVHVDKKNIIIGWDTDTFYDLEQREQINRVYFQIGHNEVAVTPLHEWSLRDSERCPAYSGGCFRYPVEKLQTQDTELSLEFYVDMHVYNNAGHSITVRTETFIIPSRFSPGHALINDIDPATAMGTDDINVHFTPNTLCWDWKGFKHQEVIKLEVGVGTSNSTCDVLPFRPINETKRLCITDHRIPENVKLFPVMRATSSGGSTLSSSDGVFILNETNLRSNLHVSIGEECTWAQTQTIDVTFENDSCTISVNNQVQVGQIYTIEIQSNTFTDLSTKDGLLQTVSNNTQTIYSFSPFTERPTFTIKGYPNTWTVLHVRQCSSISKKYTKETDKVTLNWVADKIMLMQLSLHAAVAKVFNGSLEYVTFYQRADFSATNITIQGLHLQAGFTYAINIKACSYTRCIEPVLSPNFEVDGTIPNGKFLSGKLKALADSSWFDIELSWKAFSAGSDVLFYQWTISNNNKGSAALKAWQTYIPSSKGIYQVNATLKLPVHGHSTLFGCVRAFVKSGRHGTVCNALEKSEQEKYQNVVYVFDATAPVWNSIKSLLTSSNIGERYSVLHDNELNFGNNTKEVAGAILYASERTVTWYLMTSLERAKKCDSDMHCLQETSSNTGYAVFKNLEPNQLYFICAYSNTTTIQREWFKETLEKISACSNGFVLDNTPPIPGHLYVSNTFGFLNDKKNIILTWDPFKDNDHAEELGYVGGIESYSIGIGLRPGGDDVTNFTSVGLVTSFVVDSVSVRNGLPVYFTVKGVDHAGNTASVTSERLVVDTTSPCVGHSIVQDQDLDGEAFITTDNLPVYLIGFDDTESGIAYFEVGIGTKPHFADKVPVFISEEDFAEISFTDNELHDGHVYYMLARAVNHAGLKSEFSTLAMIADKSPPVGGQVMDGHWTEEKDQDFQTETDKIYGHWKGFSDEHSGLSYYLVGLGTEPYKDDVEAMLDVGLVKDIEWHGQFDPGQKYFVTVKACNNADLCTTRASDGVTMDNSPPVQGLVTVGFGDSHRKYQSHTSSVHVHWSGFEDPQSGIDHYELCIGKTPRTCEILPFVNCLFHSNVIRTNLSLVTNTDLYATVTAFNKVGMNVSHTSDSFRVDDTPPVSTQTPSFLIDYSSVPNKTGQWDKSVLILSWKFSDTDSPIISHEVTLHTHHEGHTPIEHVKIGPQNTITFTLDGKSWLQNGDSYYAVVTSCNSAGLCTNGRSNSLLIDSTPPHLGGFKPPMLWNNFNDSSGKLKSNVTLTWYGFHDQESDIEKYFLAVSRSYTGTELTNGIKTISADISSDIQTNFILAEPLVADDLLILTIWAENRVGLNSSIARVSVNVLSESRTRDVSVMKGILEIEKHSCDIHFCNKDCTCAVVGKPCAEVQYNQTCKELSLSLNASETPDVKVFHGLASYPQTVGLSSACLTGHWQIETNMNKTSTDILRYEWSSGIHNEPFGEGVFDLKNENPWEDVGLRNEGIYCLSPNRSLSHGEQYVIYVRAWFSFDQYATYKSDPLKIDQTPPSQSRGKTVLDSSENCVGDLDIIDWMDSISACWKGVFTEQQGMITHYTVSLGVSFYADDILPVTNVGLTTNLTLRNLSLSHGTKYFFTVMAYNDVGLHSTVTSDGFVVDMDNPIAGIAFNTPRQQNKPFHSNPHSIGFSWHGFQDSFSGIRSYYVAVSKSENGTIGTHSFKNVGLKTNIVFNNLTLSHGNKYYGVIRAVDNVGHFSKTVVSKAVSVDLTPPKGLKCLNFTRIQDFNVYDARTLHFTADVLLNTMYLVKGFLDVKDEIPKLLLNVDRLHVKVPVSQNHNGKIEFEYRFLSDSSRTVNISIDIKTRNYANASVSWFACTDTSDDEKSAVTVRQISPSTILVNTFIVDMDSSLYKVEIGAGTKRDGFQIQSLSRSHSRVSSTLIRTEMAHGTPVYITVIAENKAGLTSVFHAGPLIMDHTSPIITDLLASLRLNNDNIDGRSEKKTNVEASWKVSDDESGVQKCYCSIGKHPRSSDVQTTWLSNTLTSCTATELRLQHGDKVFLNVKCVNNIELAAELSSEPLIVSISEPEAHSASVSFIPLNHASPMFTAVDDFPINIQSNRSDVELRWKGFVDPSGIDHFEYRLLAEENTIVDWTSSGKKQGAAITGLSLPDGYLTTEVRAINIGRFSSVAVNSTIHVVGSSPFLTGRGLVIKQYGDKLHLNWRDVFDTLEGVPLSFSIIIGTRSGYTDVLDIDYTSGHVIDVEVPESTIITPNLKELFLKITCTYATGLYTTYSTNYKME